MSLAENIIKFRKANGLSQAELAQELHIARQSVSKWEQGENLPSIDNLITLSGLLDISLDELITGSAYLHFPLAFGKPKNKLALWLLFAVTFGGSLILFMSEKMYGNNVRALVVSGLWTLIVYPLLTYYMYDFKRYYTYWTLDKKGIHYTIPQTKLFKGLFDELLLPVFALFGSRKTFYVPYNEISSIEIDWQTGDTKRVPKQFGLIVKTEATEIWLDVRSYYLRRSKEQQLLGSVLLFLKRKQFAYIDPQQVTKRIVEKQELIARPPKVYKLAVLCVLAAIFFYLVHEPVLSAVFQLLIFILAMYIFIIDVMWGRHSSKYPIEFYRVVDIKITANKPIQQPDEVRFPNDLHLVSVSKNGKRWRVVTNATHGEIELMTQQFLAETQQIRGAAIHVETAPTRI